MSLSSQTSKGILWNIAEQFSKRGISILVTLLLAKFLAPEDFGLVAMMTVFISLGQSLMDSGFRDALVRLEKISSVDLSTAFYANIVFGLISYVVLFVSAPYISIFYEEPRLIELIRFASLTIIVMSFQVVQVASLSRKLDFKAQLKASLPASIISGIIAVILAYYEVGVWALVTQIILNSLIHTTLLWYTVGWRPTLQFSWYNLKELYNFGYKIFISGAINTVFQNLYVIVIAKLFSASVAGLYFFANKVKDLLIHQIIKAIQKVTYPALSSVQYDNLRLKLSYKKIIILMTGVLFPCSLFLSVIAEPLFESFLSEKWWGAIPFFQLLCLASVMLPLHSVNLNILKVKGRSDLFLFLEVLKKVMSSLMLFFTYRYGVEAIIIGQIIVSIISLLPNSYYTFQLLGYKFREQVEDFSPSLLIAITVSSLSYLAISYSSFSNIVLLITLPVFMVLSFFLLSLIFNKKLIDLIFYFFFRRDSKM